MRHMLLALLLFTVIGCGTEPSAGGGGGGAADSPEKPDVTLVQPGTESTAKVQPETESTAKAPAVAAEESGNVWDSPGRLVRSIARTFDDPNLRLRSFVSIATAQQQAGENVQAVATFRQAVQMAGTMGDSPLIHGILSEISVGLARVGELQQAVEVAQTIQTIQPKEQARGFQVNAFRNAALARIAPILARGGEIQKAVALTQDIGSGPEQEQVRGLIAIALAKSDQIQPALKITQTIQNRRTGVAVLSGIVIAQVRAKDQTGALATLKDAVERVQGIEDTSEKVSALIYIAEAHIEMGDRDQAVAILQQAVDITAMIEDPNHRMQALSSLAVLQVRTKNKAQALTTLKQAVEFVREKSDKSRDNLIYSGGIAVALVKAGEHVQAMELALSLDGFFRAPLVCSVAHTLISAGYKAQALEMLQKALDTVQKERGPGRIMALTHYASVQAEAGSRAQAVATLQQALELWQQSASSGLFLSVISMSLATRLAPAGTDSYSDTDAALFPVPGFTSADQMVYGMKQSFSPEEKQLALKLVEAVR